MQYFNFPHTIFITIDNKRFVGPSILQPNNEVIIKYSLLYRKLPLAL